MWEDSEPQNLSEITGLQNCRVKETLQKRSLLYRPHESHFAVLANNRGLILLETGELQYISFSDRR